jgi:hypothetical protein
MRRKRGRLNPRRQKKTRQGGQQQQFYKIHQIHQKLQRRRPQDGDLSEVKSFAKAMATYYSHSNKFMESRSCLDCQLAVTNMESNAHGRRAVVYSCDEGIKGFDAPDDDPMKSALTCDLILCPKCEAKRCIEYNTVNSERQSGGVKRCRRQTGVQN